MRTLEELEGSFRGRTLLVVSCGPSALHWKEVRSTLPADTVIGCVKQAIFLCRSEAEIHFFNAFNCQRYFPHNRQALKIYVEDEQSPVNFNSTDLTFSLDPKTCQGLETSVAATERFEDYTIERAGLVKPWGPGIVYEIVVYLALHLGFRAIHTVGWDVVLESPRAKDGVTRIKHFYSLQDIPRRQTTTDYEWLTARSAIYQTQALARHLLGRTYNRMPAADKSGEVPVILEALPRFFSWIESHDISIRVHTILKDAVVGAEIRKYVVDLTNEHD